MAKRKQQHKQPKAYYSQGMQIGDRHDQRELRGEVQLANDRYVNKQDYDLSWFHPTNKQNEIIRSILEKDCTLIDAPSGCGKSTTAIYQALKMLKSGDYRKIVFIKTPTQLGIDDVGYLGTNEAKFEFPLLAMRSIFESFMTKEKLQMEEKNDRIEFMFPNWLGGMTFSNCVVIIDEMQWFTPEMVKLVIERADDSCKVVCMFDSKQRYANRQRPDGAKDLVEKVTEVVDGVIYVKEPLFGYVRLDHNENRRGALSKRVTELYDNLTFSK